MAGADPFTGPGTSGDGLGSFRVISWNVCCTPVDQESRGRLIATAIERERPDIVCLQEVWPGLAEEIASAAEMHVSVVGDFPRSVPSNVAILSRQPALAAWSGSLPGKGDSGSTSEHAYAVVEVAPGVPWIAHCVHLAWGSRSEGTRARQARHVVQQADALARTYPQAVQVMAGDFNALPQSQTIRFLTGLGPLEGTETLWVDAWEKCGSGPGFTSDPGLDLAAGTAASVGILKPSLLPQRRIDYILVHGYAHGRPGCPLGVRLLEAGQASDHHGLIAELWDGVAVPAGVTPP